MHQSAGGDAPAEAFHELGRLGVGVVDGVQELQREGQLERVRVVAHRLDRYQTELVGPGPPRMSGDCRVLGGDAVRDGRDDGGDLQRGNGRIRLAARA
jgi:hypothetical protein